MNRSPSCSVICRFLNCSTVRGHKICVSTCISKLVRNCSHSRSWIPSIPSIRGVIYYTGCTVWESSYNSILPIFKNNIGIVPNVCARVHGGPGISCICSSSSVSTPSSYIACIGIGKTNPLDTLVGTRPKLFPSISGIIGS